jgi:hypothetical protein
MERDTFEGVIYHAEAPDLFFTIDRQAAPSPFDWVAVERKADGRLTIEPYHGQDHYAGAVVLNFYLLQHSTQWTPRLAGRPLPY